MPDNKIQYRFSASPWQYTGPAGWIFLSLPEDLSKEIRDSFQEHEAGWGRLPATARIGKTEWKTAIWFDTKANAYLLPLKADIRKKESITVGKQVEVVVYV